MARPEKVAVVESVAELFKDARSVVLNDFTGLDVEKVSELRRLCRESNVEFRVVKNTLAKLGVAKTEAAELDGYFEGPTALAVSRDSENLGAKILAKFAKDNPKLEVRIGVLSGKPLTKENIDSLSKLPPREVLLSMLLGTLKAPTSSLVYVLSGVLSKFARTLLAIQQEKEKSANT